RRCSTRSKIFSSSTCSRASWWPSCPRRAPCGPACRRSEERRGGKEGRSLCDWSSDVCSSDLDAAQRGRRSSRVRPVPELPGGRAARGEHPAARHVGDRKSVVEGKRGDLCVTGVQTCALPI